MAARLFEVIERFDEVQNVHASIRVFVAQGVLHVEDLVLVEFAIEVHTLDVNLVHLHAEAIGHHDDGVHGCKLGHWHIHVVIVDTADLAEAISDETGLVVHNIACGIFHCLEDPL